MIDTGSLHASRGRDLVGVRRIWQLVGGVQVPRIFPQVRIRRFVGSPGYHCCCRRRGFEERIARRQPLKNLGMGRWKKNRWFGVCNNSGVDLTLLPVAAVTKSKSRYKNAGVGALGPD